jgi:PAS domain S-box-containing protein
MKLRDLVPHRISHWIGLGVATLVFVSTFLVAWQVLILSSGVLLEHELLDLGNDTTLAARKLANPIRELQKDVLVYANVPAIARLADPVSFDETDARVALTEILREDAGGWYVEACAVWPDSDRMIGVYRRVQSAEKEGIASASTIEKMDGPCSSVARAAASAVHRLNSGSGPDAAQVRLPTDGWTPTGPALISAAAPLEATEGTGVGPALVLTLDLRPVLREMIHDARLLTFVFDQDGSLLLHPRFLAGRRPESIHKSPFLLGIFGPFLPNGAKEDAGYADWENEGKAVVVGAAGDINGYDYYFAEGHPQRNGEGFLKEVAQKVVWNEKELTNALRTMNKAHPDDPTLRVDAIPGGKLLRLSHTNSNMLRQAMLEVEKRVPNIEWRTNGSYPFPDQITHCRTLGVHLVKFALDPDKPRNWLAVATAASKEEIVGDIYDRVEGPISKLKIGVAIGAAALALLLSSLITLPLKAITKAAPQVAAGGDVTALPQPLLGRRDEIGSLARAFRSMADKVQENQNRLKTILETAAEGIVTIDPEGRIESFNQAAERIFGYDSEEIIGRDAVELELRRKRQPTADLDSPEDSRLEFGRAVGTTLQVVGHRKNGTAFPMEVAVSQTLFRGRPLRSVIVRDITERESARARIEVLNNQLKQQNDDLERRVEERTASLNEAVEELKVAKEATDSAMKAQVQFLNNISHDLRSPLTVVLGYSQDMLRKAPKLGYDRFVPDLERVVNRGRDLLELINDLLNVSKYVEGRQLELDLSEFDVAAMIHRRTEGVDYLALNQHNKLIVDCDSDLGTMFADETRVWRILMNLLSNSCKFTRKGTIRLESRREKSGNCDEIVFRVTDTGIGMSREQIARLFAPFETVHAESVRLGGVGLGLSICQIYCRLMGGSIDVESKPGQGTKFTVRLPSQVGSEMGQPISPVSNTLQSIRMPAVDPSIPYRDSDQANLVLIIDDDASVCELMQRCLDEQGIPSRSAYSGEEGLLLAKQLHPTAIVLDVVMPGIDGWAVLAALKTDARTADVPIIMATMVDERERGKALGADEFLAKPFALDRLATLVRKYIAERPSPHVLIVEDDVDARRQLAAFLHEQNWIVTEAPSAEEALESIGRDRPDIILLDLMLPQMDGFGLIELVRRNEAWMSIPILVITAAELSSEKRRWLQGQVEQVLSKELFSRDDLIREIRAQLLENNTSKLVRVSEDNHV